MEEQNPEFQEEGIEDRDPAIIERKLAIAKTRSKINHLHQSKLEEKPQTFVGRMSVAFYKLIGVKPEGVRRQ